MSALIKSPTLLLGATGNKWKIADMKQAALELMGGALQIVSAKELKLPEPAETEQTFFGNALLKASAAAEAAEMQALAEDSGFCVEALNGAPGVYSARWREERGEERVDQFIIDSLHGKSNRKAWFNCTAVIVSAKGEILARSEAILSGQISSESRGDLRFGYGRIFVPDGLNRTFAELKAQEQAEMTPRVVAFKQVMSTAYGVALT